ncbi:CpaF family protein [soil metagenome]
MEEARNALSQNLAQSSLLRPDQSEEAEACLVLRDVIEQHQRHRVNSRQPALTQSQQDTLHKRLFDTFFQFGPLQEHLDNPLVEELIVNGPRSGFLLLVGGTKRPFDPGFSSDDEVRALLSRVVARAGRRIDESSPAVDVRLPGGARLHAILPPLTQHVCLTVRRHRLVADSLDELIELGTITSEAASFLADSVRGGLNILVSGGTASGKTTTLNALGRAIPNEERIVTVEETIELRLASVLPDCVSLEARSANSEGVGRISIRELVRHALRMRPSRIVVGEVRGAEALDMLSAMNTGHEGSMGTLHANSARQALSKLRTYLLMAEEGISSEVATEMIGETVDLVVHLQLHRSGGKRQVVQIAEVVGIESGRILTNDLFRMDASELVRTNIRPRFFDRLGQSDFQHSRPTSGNGSSPMKGTW